MFSNITNFSDITMYAVFYSLGFSLQNREGLERGVTLRNAQNRKGLYHLMNETINPGILSESKSKFYSLHLFTPLTLTLTPSCSMPRSCQL